MINEFQEGPVTPNLKGYPENFQYSDAPVHTERRNSSDRRSEYVDVNVQQPVFEEPQITLKKQDSQIKKLQNQLEASDIRFLNILTELKVLLGLEMNEIQELSNTQLIELLKANQSRFQGLISTEKLPLNFPHIYMNAVREFSDPEITKEFFEICLDRSLIDRGFERTLWRLFQGGLYGRFHGWDQPAKDVCKMSLPCWSYTEKKYHLINFHYKRVETFKSFDSLQQQAVYRMSESFPGIDFLYIGKLQMIFIQSSLKSFNDHEKDPKTPVFFAESSKYGVSPFLIDTKVKQLKDKHFSKSYIFMNPKESFINDFPANWTKYIETNKVDSVSVYGCPGEALLNVTVKNIEEDAHLRRYMQLYQPDLQQVNSKQIQKVAETIKRINEENK